MVLYSLLVSYETRRNYHQGKLDDINYAFLFIFYVKPFGNPHLRPGPYVPAKCFNSRLCQTFRDVHFMILFLLVSCISNTRHDKITIKGDNLILKAPLVKGRYFGLNKKL